MKTCILKLLAFFFVFGCLPVTIRAQVGQTQGSDYYYNYFDTNSLGVLGTTTGGATTIGLSTGPSTGNLSTASGYSLTSKATNTSGYIGGSYFPSTNLSTNDWEWSVLYQCNLAGISTATKPTDISGSTGISAGANAWRYWLYATSSNPTLSGTSGFYITQGSDGKIQLWQKDSGGTISKLMSSDNALTYGQIYNIKVQRYTGGSSTKWVMYVGAYSAAATEATTIQTTSPNSFNSVPTQYTSSILETATTTTAGNNIFKWDEFKMYTRKLVFTAVNSAANGVSQSPVLSGTSNLILYGLQIQTRGTYNFNQIYIGSTATNNGASSYLNSPGSLYKSADGNFSTTTDPIIAGLVILDASAQNNGVTTPVLNDVVASSGDPLTGLPTTASYYFVSTSSKTTFPSPANGTLIYNGVTTIYDKSTGTSYTNFTNTNTIGNTIVYGSLIDWKGSTSIDWMTASNWSPARVPTANDAVRIGVVSYTRQPTVQTPPNTIASLTFGTLNGTSPAATTTLTINTGQTLTVNGNIIQYHNSSNGGVNTTITGAGTGTLVCNSFTVGDATAPPPPSGDITFGGGVPPTNNSTIIDCSVPILTITGGLNLNSTSSALGTYTIFFIFPATGYCTNNPIFNLNSGVITANNITTTNSNYNTNNSAIYNGDTGTGATTLNLLGATPVTAATGGQIDFTNGGLGTGIVNYAAASGTQTVYTTNDAAIGATPNYDNLTLSAASAKTVDGGLLTINANWNTSGGTVSLVANDPTITISGNWTNSTTVTQDTGPITITGNLTNNSGGSLVLGSADLSIAGNYSNNLGGVYTQSTGTTHFSGTGSQSLIDNSSTGTIFNKVIFSGGALTSPKTMSGTGGFAVSSTGTLSLANNATTKLDAGGVLTLKSDASSTATVTQILNTTSTIIGNVKAERYFSGGAVATYRGYRLGSSAVNTNAVTSNAGATALYSLDFLSTSPSSIFTAGPGGTGSGFTSLGAGNSTIYLYREDLPSSAASFNGGNFKGVYAINTGTTFLVANTAGTGSTSTTLPVGNGYMLYYIGDKTLVAAKVTRSGGKFADPESSTSTAVGTLNQGDVPVKIWFRPNTFFSYTIGISNSISLSYARAFNLVGNPYPSSIDWDKFTNGGADPGTGIYGPNLKNSVYVFDYRSKNYGVYQQGTTGGTGTRNSSHIIVSGQGFFVKVDSSKTVTAAKLTFHEGAKINIQNTGNALLFKSALATTQMLRIKLSQDSINADDIILTFEPEAKNEYESDKDADYLQGIGSAVSLTSYAFNSNKKLAINHMHSIDETTRIKLYASASSSAILDTLSATGFDSLDPRFDVYLIDHYKKDSIFFSKYKQYLFHVDRNDASSYGSDRFELVFHKNSEYNYHPLGFTAKAAKEGALLTWKVEKENTFTSFTIERDNGSGQFISLYTVQSNGSSNYAYLDKNPLTGVNNYRLKQIDAFGNIAYSTATLNFNSRLSTADDFFSLYPNPVITQFNIKINTPAIPKQVQVRVTDLMGNTVINTKNPGDNIRINAYNLMPGAYIVEVTDTSTKITLGQKKLIKQ